ncbi:premnaspirodiene oxygenase-like [Coffea arabica]|uniref:Premnaspirodiene oxygenase-like n=1 Tax=Coffea arabica TaxID=13443 RepID=A0A6P6SE04_COFAR|nr:premnaspirodiene oxygenase-like isoform X1 [Coffea arabica]
MEITFPAFLVSILFFFLLWKFNRLFIKSSKRTDNPRKPPGPWKIPLIGSMHHLAGSLPHLALRDMAKKFGPIMHLQMGEISTVIISAAQEAKQVLKVHDIAFADRPELLASKILGYNNLDIAFSPYGDYWKQMRKICLLELLSPKSVRSFGSLREDEASKVIRSIKSSSNSPVNVTEKVFSFTNGVVCRAAFGRSFGHQDVLIPLINEAILAGGGFDIADLFPSLKFLHSLSGLKPKLLKLHHEIGQLLENIINEHKEKQTSNLVDSQSAEEDLVDVLLRLKERGDFNISTDSIKAVIWDVFAAGTETSAATLDYAMAELIRNPSVMEKAQAGLRQVLEGKETVQETDLKELNYLKAVIKETLRLHPPLPLILPRECREACKIAGYDIPIKTKVMINAWAIHRDPEVWPNPEKFKPERFLDSGIDSIGSNFEYIPFGGGRRICPGISFGSAGVELLLAKLLYHFDWSLPNGTAGPQMPDMTEILGATARRKNSLTLVATFHDPSA